MQDFKDGVPRTAYKGVVRVYFDSCLIYIAAKEKNRWSGYSKDWWLVQVFVHRSALKGVKLFVMSQNKSLS